MDEDEASGPVSEAPEIAVEDRPRNGTEWLTESGQSYFGLNGPRMRERGWAVLPQKRDGRSISNVVGRWKQYQDAAPSMQLTKRWASAASGENIAILMGPVSGNTICLDLDITDQDLSLHVQEIAEDVLGLSPFRRVGRRPKMALFYRQPAGVTIANKTYHLLTADGSGKSDHAIEIQGRGKLMTAFGPHHETGATFTWQDKLPWHFGPEIAPEITPELLDKFLGVVEAQARGFHRNVGAKSDAQWDYVDSHGVDRPRLRRDAEFSEYVRDADGYVYDGREKFVWLMCSQAAKLNPAACGDDRGVAKITAAALESCRSEMRMDGRWSEGYLQQEVAEKTRRACAAVANGDVQPIYRDGGVVPTSDGLSSKITKTKNLIKPTNVTDAFSWLPVSGKAINATLMPGPEGSAEAWAMKADRSAVHTKVTETIDAGLQAFAADVRAGRRNGPIHVIKAPTGAGKTARSVAFLMEDPDTIADDNLPDGERRGAFAFLMPTHANIAEVRSRALAMGLDPNLDDADLEAAAAAVGILSEKVAEDAIAELRAMAVGSPVRTMVYRGKIAAGCLLADRMKALIDADISASGLCKSTVKGPDGERVEATCPHYATCPAIEQKAMLRSHHIVFMPRNFLTLNIPEEAKSFRAVIADEAILDLLAHTNKIPLDALNIERKEPSLTKAEIEEGADAAYMLKQRGIVRDVVVEGLEAGKDPAKFLREKVPHDCIKLVKIAKRVCSSAIQSGQTVRPSMSDDDFKALTSRPTSEFVKAEHRFWSIVLEDLEANLLVELAGKKPRRDTRIKMLFHEEPEIVMSWRSEHNWSELPFLLLDASAKPELLERVFLGRAIVTYECENDANLFVAAFPDEKFAISKLMGTDGKTDKLEAAGMLLKLRRAIVAISSAHSDGRVVVCTTKPIRTALCYGWVPPANADFMHDGATAGLDFAKNHVALISIGRTELPTWINDGIVAALTHDMDDRPPCIDPYGTGKDAKGKGLRPHVVSRFLKLRNGSLALCQHQQHESYFAKAVQALAREEAIRQRIGRLRGVFRETPGIVYLLGEAIPDDVIIDDLRSMADLVGYEILDAARRLDGILCSEIIAKNAEDEWTMPAAEKAIQKLGSRYLRNYNKVTYEGVDGETRTAFVPAFHEDVDNTRLLEWAGRLGMKMTIVGKVAGSDAVRPKDIRPIDAVEMDLGTIEERRVVEEGIHREITKDAMSRGEYKFASATPLGMKRALYRVWKESEDAAEIGQIQLFRYLTGTTPALATISDSMEERAADQEMRQAS